MLEHTAPPQAMWNLFSPAVRPVAAFQKTATVGKPYSLGPRWHIPVMRCAANDACGGSSAWIVHIAWHDVLE